MGEEKMTNDKSLPLIVGGTVVAVSGYLLYRVLFREPKTELIVQYQDVEDLQAAEIIRNALKPDLFVSGWVDVRTVDRPVVVVGGQYVNSVYSDLITLAGMPEIIESMTDGYISVRIYNGQKFYGVAGWTKAGTLAAANYIKENGLPIEDVTIPV